MTERDVAGVRAAYNELERQMMNGRHKPALYDVPSGEPLQGIDGIVDLASLAAAIIAAADKWSAENPSN